jgi:hypothetical protein
MAIHRVEAIRSLHKGSYDKATADKIDWKDGHTTTDAENTAIDAEQTRLQTLDAYQAPRKAEYDQLNQFEMQFDDDRDSTTTWVDTINEIKGRHPK